MSVLKLEIDFLLCTLTAISSC